MLGAKDGDNEASRAAGKHGGEGDKHGRQIGSKTNFQPTMTQCASVIAEIEILEQSEQPLLWKEVIWKLHPQLVGPFSGHVLSFLTLESAQPIEKHACPPDFLIGWDRYG